MSKSLSNYPELEGTESIETGSATTMQISLSNYPELEGTERPWPGSMQTITTCLSNYPELEGTESLKEIELTFEGFMSQ